jgi:hypothetical protein
MYVCTTEEHREVLRIDPFLNNPRARLRRRDPNVKFPVRNRNHTICPQVVPLVPGFADARSSDRLFWAGRSPRSVISANHTLSISN